MVGMHALIRGMVAVLAGATQAIDDDHLGMRCRQDHVRQGQLGVEPIEGDGSGDVSLAECGLLAGIDEDHPSQQTTRILEPPQRLLGGHGARDPGRRPIRRLPLRC